MILSKADMKQWLSKICRSDPDFEIEATLISSHEVTLRYAMNRIHQNLDEAQTYCSIRVMKDKRTGEASANQVDQETIDQLLVKAKHYCQLSSHADTQVGFTAKNEMRQACEQTNENPASMDLDQITSHVDAVFTCSKNSGLEAAGVFSCSHRRTGFATTNGGQVITDQNSSRMNVMLFNGDESKSGWASQASTQC